MFRGRANVFLLQTDRPRLAGSRVVGASGGRSGVSVGRHAVAPILRRRLRGRRDDCESNPSGILRQSHSQSQLRDDDKVDANVKNQPAHVRRLLLHEQVPRAIAVHRANGEAPALGPNGSSLAGFQSGHNMRV